MARHLRVVHATINRPDERGTPEADRTGPFITLNVMSEDLKTRPVHGIPLTEDEAIRLASQLLEAVRHKRGSYR